MTPLVLLPARRVAPGERARTDQVSVGARYVDAIARAGGREVVVAPGPLDAGRADELLARVDALVLPGGPDVAPGRYGAEPHPATYGVDVGRDDFEVALLEAAMRAGTPTLAICRGLQVLDVALGGSLHQHLPDRPDLLAHSPATFHSPANELGALHDVLVTPGTRLAAAAGTTTVRGVSSYHHQAVDRVGRDLRVVARSADGVVEALEHADGWLVAVQWHPEDTAAHDPAQQGLFDELVRQASARRSIRPVG